MTLKLSKLRCDDPEVCRRAHLFQLVGMSLIDKECLGELKRVLAKLNEDGSTLGIGAIGILYLWSINDYKIKASRPVLSVLNQCIDYLTEESEPKVKAMERGLNDTDKQEAERIKRSYSIYHLNRCISI